MLLKIELNNRAQCENVSFLATVSKSRPYNVPFTPPNESVMGPGWKVHAGLSTCILTATGARISVGKFMQVSLHVY